MSKFDLFTEQEFENRRTKLRERLDVDNAIIFNRPDLFYYSGTGLDGIITISENEMVRYVRRNLEIAKQESFLSAKFMSSFRLFKELGKSKPEQLGLELDILPHKTVSYIRKAYGNPELIDIGDELRMIRSVKSAEEQKYMKQAAAQTDASFEYIKDMIKPGKTEVEISTEIVKFLRREGHPGYVNVRMFQHNYTTSAYVMAGESTATLNSLFGPVSGQGMCKLHKNGPSRRKIKNDEAVLIDTTGVVEGYTADETRTFFLGNPPEILTDAYDVAKAIQVKSEKLLSTGADPTIIYQELHDFANEMNMENHFMGYKDDKVPFIGHGIGLELDEYPIITDKYLNPLETGNLIAMEPKFIFDRSLGGVGIEDSWIVREDGAERITLHPW